MILQTNTCEIRRFDPKDLDQLYLLIKDEAIRDNLPQIYCDNISDTKLFLDKIIDNTDYFAIHQLNQLVAIFFIEEINSSELKLYFAVRKDMRNRGIVLETIPYIIEWLKNNVTHKYISFSVGINNIQTLIYLKNLGANFFRTENMHLVYKIDLKEVKKDETLRNHPL